MTRTVFNRIERGGPQRQCGSLFEFENMQSHARSRDSCQRRLLPRVMPIRRGDNSVTRGPCPLPRIRRPVRLLILFSSHQSENVSTSSSAGKERKLGLRIGGICPLSASSEPARHRVARTKWLPQPAATFGRFRLRPARARLDQSVVCATTLQHPGAGRWVGFIPVLPPI